MHKRLWNVLRLSFTLTPKGPLLVKTGSLSPNPSLPDMQFVRTVTKNGEVVFIPGASLKGVFRSFSEKVLRTINSEWACEPFPDNPKYCGRLREEKDTAKVYRESCFACQLYGNTRLKGRIAFTDLFPDGEVKTETRYGVAISRLTNAVAHGPFDMEIVVAAGFKGSVVLENFTAWQLGLVAFTIRAINEGLVRIGFGKNRGFGEVALTVDTAVLDMAKGKGEMRATELWGVGCFLDDAERGRYGLSPVDLLSDLPAPSRTDDLAVFVRRTYDAQTWQTVAEHAVANLPKALEGEK